jgi:formate hydrogenlyase subunit 3/multisubunit Na+/H+ antiporter MnhD subunit
MTGTGVLLAATVLFPLLLAGARVLWPGFRDRAVDSLFLAPLPGLACALFGQEGAEMSLVPPLRTVLRLDESGAILLGGAALLWSAAGLYAAVTMKRERKLADFAGWWLLTLAGSLGVFIAADEAGFYLAFGLVSLAAYGLIVHDGTPRARRAAAVYMVLALVGEAFLLLAFVMLAGVTDSFNPLIANAVALLPGAATAQWIIALLVLGFALKMGLVPLHVWLPLAHPAAPMAASAVLSGVVVKAGVIGMIRFLPLGDAFAGWGVALAAQGLITAFACALIGVTQAAPKTVLAYSTVSQMGLVAVILGAGLAAGDAGAGEAAAFYALHHMLAKGALFLGVGIAATTAPSRLRPVLVVSALLGLGLAGLPLTGGAFAKLAMKPGLGGGSIALLATLAAAGSTMLMLHFVSCLSQAGSSDRTAAPHPAQRAAWLIVALASVVWPLALFPGIADKAAGDLFSLKSLAGLLWPIVLGVAGFVAVGRAGDRLPRIPEGDVIVLAERGGPLLGRVGRLAEDVDRILSRWSVASLLALGLVLAFSGALWR